MEEFAEIFSGLWPTTPTVLPTTPTALPKITDKMKELVKKKLMSKRLDTVIVDEFSLSVTVTDLISLQPRQWLTDNIINFYLELIFARNADADNLPKVQILTSFFYPKLVSAGYSGVKRWTKRRPIFDSQMVLVPIHLGNHWCLVTIDLDNQKLFYYDSLKAPNPRLLSEIKDFLIEDSKDKLKKTLDTSWTFKQRYTMTRFACGKSLENVFGNFQTNVEVNCYEKTADVLGVIGGQQQSCTWKDLEDLSSLEVYHRSTRSPYSQHSRRGTRLRPFRRGRSAVNKGKNV